MKSNDSTAGSFAACPTPGISELGLSADRLGRHADPREAALRAEAAARQLFPPADVHGVLDAAHHLRADYTATQLSALATLPWSDEVLRACAGTHLLVAGFPLSLLDLRARHPDLFPRGPRWDWYVDEPFARDVRVGRRWHLIRKTPVPATTGTTFRRQVARLPTGERGVRVCEAVYAVILHYLATGERVLEDRAVRCLDRTRHGARVLVGHFLARSVYIGPEYQDLGSSHLGLLSARQS